VFSSDTWFDALDDLNEVLRIKKTLRDEDSKPVKVAILDTGISKDYFESVKAYIKEYKDFASGDDKNPKDTSSSQHGTNSVRIVQRVYIDAEIHVGRVFETDEANDHTADLMGEVHYLIF
jgi:hypothetical protein